MQKTIDNMEDLLDPDKIALKKATRKIVSEFFLDTEDYQQKDDQLIYFIFMLILLAVIVFIWNLHIVFGIIGVAGYLWLIKNKLSTGFYFG